MDNIIETLNEIKHILSRLVGTTQLSKEMQFSEHALDKAAKEFKKLRREDNTWVSEYDIRKYIKTAPYNNTGAFIREEFGFTNFYMKGRSRFYYRKDLINLARELKKRNIDLTRYMQLKAEKVRMEGQPDKYLLRKQKKIKPYGYRIPVGIQNITALPVKKSTLKELRELQETLKQEYQNDNLTEHIEIHSEKFATAHNHFYYGMNDEIRKKVKRWIRKYNSTGYEIEAREQENRKAAKRK
jgi:hypothetical protein